MRLGSSILGGKPMRIPGIVDVYQVGTEWVARSWPKVQNQPNSAAQLLWRKKFKDAHAMIKTWSGVYLDAWRAVYRPPGKMWIDIAMTSIMNNPAGSDAFPKSQITAIEQIATCFHSEIDRWLIQLKIETSDFSDLNIFLAASLYPGRRMDEIMAWMDLGWSCPKGKRPHKHWKLVDKKIPLPRTMTESWQRTNSVKCDMITQRLGPALLAKLSSFSKGDDLNFAYSLIVPPIPLREIVVEVDADKPLVYQSLSEEDVWGVPRCSGWESTDTDGKCWQRQGADNVLDWIRSYDGSSPLLEYSIWHYKNDDWQFDYLKATA